MHAALIGTSSSILRLCIFTSQGSMPSAFYPPKKRVSVMVVVILMMSGLGFAEGRIFGIPGTIMGQTLLQGGPGTQPTVITTLGRNTSVQVLCKVESDVVVGGDPWWLKVHVWQTGLDGFVADFWVRCRHAGPCRVPFCPV